jgi:hypothetical protein
MNMQTPVDRDSELQTIAQTLRTLRRNAPAGLVDHHQWLIRDFGTLTTTVETLLFVLQNCTCAYFAISRSSRPVGEEHKQSTHDLHPARMADTIDVIQTCCTVYTLSQTLHQGLDAVLIPAASVSMSNITSRGNHGLLRADSPATARFSRDLATYASRITEFLHMVKLLVAYLEIIYQTMPRDTTRTHIRHYINLSEVLLDSVDLVTLAILTSNHPLPPDSPELSWSTVVEDGFNNGTQH